MSRYIQHQASQKPPKKKEKPRELTKPGSYTAAQLTDAKKIISPNGGSR